MAIFGKNNKNGANSPKESENKSANPANEAAPEKEEQIKEEITNDENPAGTIAEVTPGETIKPKFRTPEGFEFNRYFLAERRIVLENVSYETTRPAQAQGQFKLGVKDTIVAQVLGQAGVKATYNRTLRFDPEGPFVLSVSFAVMLVFNPGTRGEVDWHTIDIAEEFKKNCPGLIQQMSAKAALLVAEITSANGGVPIIPTK